MDMMDTKNDRFNSAFHAFYSIECFRRQIFSRGSGDQAVFRLLKKTDDLFSIDGREAG